jgi:ketosteroid isomerase-like protein
MRSAQVVSTIVVAFALALVGCSSESDDFESTPAASDVSSTSSDTAVAGHVAIVQRRIAANNARDWDTWEALHTPNAERTAPELSEPLKGAKAMRARIEELFTTFPDYHLELVDAFGQGDRLIARIHTRATMLGPMPFGDSIVPPTGKSFEQDWVAVLRFDGDRIASIDEFHDNYGILVQLGLTGP